MKTLSQIFAIAILTVTTSAAFATTNINEESKTDHSFQVSFLSQNLNQMVVAFENEGNDTKVALLNNEGKTIHQEAVNGKGLFAKRYDFSELDKGIYSFEIKNGTKNYSKTVVLK